MIEIYQGTDLKWYWRFRAGNGRIIADGSEGYSSKYNAQRAWGRFREQVQMIDHYGRMWQVVDGVITFKEY